MAEKTEISWTDSTVNFWWGCTKVSDGCDHCYAETLDKRFGPSHWGVGVGRKKIKSAIALIHRLDNAYADWAADRECIIGNSKVFGLPVPNIGSRRRVFIQSMSDLFDLEVPLEWFGEAWHCIEICDRIEAQIVTKRITAVEKRLAAIGCVKWPQHAGLIITIINQPEADRDIGRVIALMQKFNIPWIGLSCEPLLGRIILPPDFLAIGKRAWVICGGESGSHARPMHPDWLRSLRDQCAAAGVPFHFKQWGAWRESKEGDVFNTANGHDGKPPAFIVDPDDGAVHCFLPDKSHPRCRVMLNVGKSRTGRLLDGIEHNAFPKAHP